MSDYLIGTCFLLIIGAKLYFLASFKAETVAPIGLSILSITVYIALLSSLCCIKLRKENAGRVSIVIFVLMGYIAAFWKYSIDEIGVFFLLFYLFGYSFFGYVLWVCAEEDRLLKEK